MTPADVLAGKPHLVPFEPGGLDAEAPVHLLDDPITPLDRLFIRTIGRLPDPVPAHRWRLVVDGLVHRPTVFSLDDLQRRFETITVTTVMECAGNGRAGFVPPTSGVPWRGGAVGCLRFTGVRMADMLAACGVGAGAAYTAHHSPDRLADGRPAISRGVPVAKALAPETLLAFAVNGEPLPFAHGGPLRVVAPGFPGSAWQKWLTRLTLRDRVHDGPQMNGLDYRLPRGPVRPDEPIDPAMFDPITAMPVKAMITAPAAGARLPLGEPVEIRGFAWSGVAPIEGVEVSIDGGISHAPARLEPAEGPWAWRRFRLAWRPTGRGEVVLAARTRDASGAVQPEVAAWNPKGYCNNAVCKLPVTIV